MDEVFEIKCIPSQIAESICEMAAQVDQTENAQARKLLIKAMDALVFMINPARGELIEVYTDKAIKRKPW